MSITYKKYKHLISAYIVATIAVLATILPIIWVGMLSLKSKGQTFTRPQNGYLSQLLRIILVFGTMNFLQILSSTQL